MRRRLRVVYLPSAERDMIDYVDYLQRDAPGVAASWIDSVDRSLPRLERFPESGTVPKDERLAELGYRIVVIGEHLAFYVVYRDRVEIRRVVHGRRRYSFLL